MTMLDPLKGAMAVATSGLDAQGLRFRIASENLANAEATGSRPGADPYRRKTISFESVLDETGAQKVSVKSIGRDSTPFRLEHRPGDPAADAQGMVKISNASPIVEMADLREASRSYEANLQVIKQVREITTMTIDLLRN